MKILCADDFTPQAESAARVALDLARRTQGSIELIHVTGPGTADVLAVPADAAQVGELRADVAARLAASRDRLAAGGVPVTAHACAGEIEPSIVRRADAIGADR